MSFFIPGLGMIYSGGGYTILGVVVLLAPCTAWPLSLVLANVVGVPGLCVLGYLIFGIAQVVGSYCVAKANNMALDEAARDERDRLQREAAARAVAQAEARKQQEEAEKERRRHEIETAPARRAERLQGLIARAAEVQACYDRVMASAAPIHTALKRGESDYKERRYRPMFNAYLSAQCQYADLLTQITSVNRSMEGIKAEYENLCAEATAMNQPPPGLLPTLRTSDSLVCGVVHLQSELRRVYDMAQCNPECTSIWIQLETNGILVAGFGNLEDALNSVGARITNELNWLDQTVSSEMQRLGTQIREGDAQTARFLSDQNEAMDRNARDHQKTTERLIGEVRDVRDQLDK